MNSYSFVNTYGYSFKKKVLFGIVKLSAIDKGLSGKVQIDLSYFSKKDKFKTTKSGIIEFYDFNSNIESVEYLYKTYFDIENINNKKNLDYLIKTNLFYSNLYDKQYYGNRISLIYGIDYINKDYTVYFRFYDLENLLKTIMFFSNIINEDFIINNYKKILKSIIKLKKYYNYYYFKIKYTDSGDIFYSIVFNFDDFSNEYIFEDYLKIIKHDISKEIINDLDIIYKDYKFTEVSFNLHTASSENISFFDTKE